MVTLFYVGEKRRPKGFLPNPKKPRTMGLFLPPLGPGPDRRQSPAAKRRSAKTKFTTVKTLVNNLNANKPIDKYTYVTKRTDSTLCGSA